MSLMKLAFDYEQYLKELREDPEYQRLEKAEKESVDTFHRLRHESAEPEAYMNEHRTVISGAGTGAKVGGALGAFHGVRDGLDSASKARSGFLGTTGRMLVKGLGYAALGSYAGAGIGGLAAVPLAHKRGKDYQEKYPEVAAAENNMYDASMKLETYEDQKAEEKTAGVVNYLGNVTGIKAALAKRDLSKFDNAETFFNTVQKDGVEHYFNQLKGKTNVLKKLERDKNQAREDAILPGMVVGVTGLAAGLNVLNHKLEKDLLKEKR